MAQLPTKVIYTFLTPGILKQAIAAGEIEERDAVRFKESDVVRYYNRKLQTHFKFAQWEEFFYTFHSARDLSHGVDSASYVMAAHAYEVAYSNTPKSLEMLDHIRTSPGYALSLHLLSAYRDLKSQEIAPLPCDWVSIVNICSVIALGKEPPKTKYEQQLASPRLAWHYELAPWKYSRSVAERVDEMVFKQRRQLT